MLNELDYFLSHHVLEIEPKLILIRGRGESFCSGADLVDFSSSERFAFIEKFNTVLQSLQQCKWPVISLLHGKIFGGGIGLAAVSDIVVAEKSTVFAFSEVKLGLIPAVLSSFLSLETNQGLVRSLMLSARAFDVNEAKNMGLVHEIFQNNIDDYITELMEILLKNDTEAMIMTKQLLNHQFRLNTPDEKSKYALELIKSVLKEDQVVDNLKSFLKK